MHSYIILGQTAVGKSKYAINLAKEINGEIISADSMQVYRGMDIGTAKLSLSERVGVPHHLIDIRNPDEEWTVSDFIGETQNIKLKIQSKGKTPIVVGGTGLYLWALIEGFSFPLVPADKKIRENLEKQPLSILYSQLSTLDPASAQKIHPNDKKRIMRALEVYALTGTPISKRQENKKLKIKNIKSEYKIIGLTLPRQEVYKRINERVDNMIKKGLIGEVEGLLAKGYPKNLPSMQALGYKETIKHIEGDWSQDEMIEELKKRTRNFARRQMTWFRRFKNVEWVKVG